VPSRDPSARDWTGIVEVRFQDYSPFTASGRLWSSLTPRPRFQFEVDLRETGGVSHLRVGPAIIVLADEGLEYEAMVSYTDGFMLRGSLTGRPPLPESTAFAMGFSVINLHPDIRLPRSLEVDGWRIETWLADDVQPEQRRESMYENTHGGRISRVGDEPFAITDAFEVLDRRWRLAVSFATGSRVGVWEHHAESQAGRLSWVARGSPWVQPFANRYQPVRISSSGDAATAITSLMRHLDTPAMALAVNYLLESLDTTIPCELQITSACAGLECLSWYTLVESSHAGTRRERKARFERMRAADKFRHTFSRAVPASARFPAMDTTSIPQDAAKDIFSAVAWLRNRAVHPTGGVLESQAAIEGTRAAICILTLGVLHFIDFRGQFLDTLGPATTYCQVPWAAHPT
jgi:hypothetical protein